MRNAEWMQKTLFQPTLLAFTRSDGTPPPRHRPILFQPTLLAFTRSDDAPRDVGDERKKFQPTLLAFTRSDLRSSRAARSG